MGATMNALKSGLIQIAVFGLMLPSASGQTRGGDSDLSAVGKTFEELVGDVMRTTIGNVSVVGYAFTSPPNEGNAPYGDKGVGVQIESLQGKNQVNHLDIDLHRFAFDIPSNHRIGTEAMPLTAAQQELLNKDPNTFLQELNREFTAENHDPDVNRDFSIQAHGDYSAPKNSDSKQFRRTPLGSPNGQSGTEEGSRHSGLKAYQFLFVESLRAKNGADELIEKFGGRSPETSRGYTLYIPAKAKFYGWITMIKFQMITDADITGRHSSDQLDNTLATGQAFFDYIEGLAGRHALGFKDFVTKQEVHEWLKTLQAEYRQAFKTGNQVKLDQIKNDLDVMSWPDFQ